MSLSEKAGRAVGALAVSGLTSSFRYARGVYRGHAGFTDRRARNLTEKVLFKSGAGSLVYMNRIALGLARVGARMEGISVQEYQRRRERETKKHVYTFLAAHPYGVTAKYVRRIML